MNVSFPHVSKQSLAKIYNLQSFETSSKYDSRLKMNFIVYHIVTGQVHRRMKLCHIWLKVIIITQTMSILHIWCWSFDVNFFL